MWLYFEFNKHFLTWRAYFVLILKLKNDIVTWIDLLKLFGPVIFQGHKVETFRRQHDLNLVSIKSKTALKSAKLLVRFSVSTHSNKDVLVGEIL